VVGSLLCTKAFRQESTKKRFKSLQILHFFLICCIFSLNLAVLAIADEYGPTFGLSDGLIISPNAEPRQINCEDAAGRDCGQLVSQR